MKKAANIIFILFLLFSASFAATQTVTNTLDSGPGSFRQALVDAGNGDTIAFNISSAEAGVSTGEVYSGWVSNEVTGYRWFRIVLNEALVVVKNNLMIDGTTCTTSDVTSPTDGPVIEIVAPMSDAITMEGAGNTIKGLCINTISNGIFIHSSSNTISGNIIGLSVSGEALTSVICEIGIIISGESNTVGGSMAADRNVISGCTQYGIFLMLSNSNIIKGNYVGLTASGEGIVPTTFGIMIVGGSGNIVGGLNPGEGNVVSGCDFNPAYGGITVLAQFPTENTSIYGNYVGTNASGTRALPNSAGVTVIGYDKNTQIGNGTSAGRNIISGNTIAGLVIYGPTSSITVESTCVYGNYLGTDKTGSIALGNGAANVFILGPVKNAHIGGSLAGQGNVISGNTVGFPGLYQGCGIAIGRNVGVVSAEITGNLIGLAADGVSALGNTIGIYITGEAKYCRIGDGTAAGSNTIAFNADSGISLEGIGTDFNKITCNSIYGNTDKGISIIDGANSGIGIATINAVTSDGSSVTIFGTSAAFAVIEVFKASGDQGKNYFGTLNADASGNWSGIVPAEAGMVTGDCVTVTQTDPNNNTSEFSIPLEASIIPPSVRNLSVTVQGSAVSGEAFNVTVAAKDAAGNTVPVLYLPVTVTADSGSVIPPSIATSEFVSGVWSGNMTLNTPGGRKLYFSYGSICTTANILVTSQTTTRIMFGPNPFNPDNGSGVIWYYLDADNETSIYLFDLSGTVVWKATYPSGAVGGKAGANSITYDGKTLWGDILGNGVYIYKVVQGNKSVGGGKIAVIK